MGAGLPFGAMKISCSSIETAVDQRREELDAKELFASKWLILHFVDLPPLKKNDGDAESTTHPRRAPAALRGLDVPASLPL